jgi:hypothetical protein
MMPVDLSGPLLSTVVQRSQLTLSAGVGFGDRSGCDLHLSDHALFVMP